MKSLLENDEWMSDNSDSTDTINPNLSSMPNSSIFVVLCLEQFFIDRYQYPISEACGKSLEIIHKRNFPVPTN